MAKRWLAIREKSIPVLRRSLIFSLSLTAVVGAVYLAKPVLWSGGLGVGKDQTVTTESVEKDLKGNVVKSIKTTKYDDGKTLWDWLSLLGVPLSLAILGYLLQQNQQKRAEVVAKEQREIAAEETKEEVLQVYFDRLSALLVDKNLLAIASKVYASETQEIESQPIIEATLEERELLDSAVDVIRARTLSILRRFENDPERKTSVIRFLIDADVVSKLKLNLGEANLSGAHLSGADLSDTNLIDSIFNDADLSEAYLSGAKFTNANLSGANLSYANLTEAFLIGTNLVGANLSGAFLSMANFSRADLSNANLIDTIFSDIDFSGANLGGARFSNNRCFTDAAKADMKERGAIFEDTP